MMLSQPLEDRQIQARFVRHHGPFHTTYAGRNVLDFGNLFRIERPDFALTIDVEGMSEYVV